MKDRSKLDKLKNDAEEMQKCKDSPAYFYNNYCRGEDQPILSDEEFEKHRLNVIQARSKRGKSFDPTFWQYPLTKDEVFFK